MNSKERAERLKERAHVASLNVYGLDPRRAETVLLPVLVEVEREAAAWGRESAGRYMEKGCLGMYTDGKPCGSCGLCGYAKDIRALPTDEDET